MKTNKILVATLIASASLLNFSCKKNDVVSPAVTNPSTTPQGKVNINFSLQVIASTSTTRTAGLTGTVVTIQSNGGTQTATTNESGIVTFAGLDEGAVNIFVKAPTGFSSYNTTATLKYANGSLTVAGTNGGTGTSDNNTGLFVDVNNNNRAFIVLNALIASVEGRIIGDFDNNNATTNAPIPQNTPVYAKASDKNVQPNTYTVMTDGNGNFKFQNLPENVDFTFSIDYTSANTQGTYSFDKSFNITNAVGTVNLPGNKLTSLGLITAY